MPDEPEVHASAGTDDDLPQISTPRIDSFIVADWAESLNGKLYLMGGGFDTIVAGSGFPHAVRFALGAILRVPWNETNRRFPVHLAVETIDGTDLGWRMDGELEAGRAAGARLGGDVVVVFAGPVQFEAEEPVDFLVRMNFAGDTRSVPVRLMDHPSRQ